MLELGMFTVYQTFDWISINFQTNVWILLFAQFGGGILSNISRVIDLSKNQGISLSSLCKRIGKTRTYLSEIQTRGRTIPLEYIPTLAEALHTTPEYLMGETDDPEIKKVPTLSGEHSKEAQEFAAEFSDFTPDEWAELRRYADFLKSQRSDEGQK